LIFAQVFHLHPVYSSVNARHSLSHPHKTATKLYFSLSQYLRPWIEKCRHHIYKLLISRRLLTSSYPSISAHNFCPVSDLPQWFNRAIYRSDQLALFAFQLCPAFC